MSNGQPVRLRRKRSRALRRVAPGRVLIAQTGGKVAPRGSKRGLGSLLPRSAGSGGTRLQEIAVQRWGSKSSLRQQDNDRHGMILMAML